MTKKEKKTCEWTYEEHMKFLRGLEVHGANLSWTDSTTLTWTHIANCVATKSEVETKEHGKKYLKALLNEMLLKETMKESIEWTVEEDAMFEQALAKWGNTPYAWSKIAVHLPGKSVNNVIDRYQLLVRDLTAIEEGRDIHADHESYQDIQHASRIKAQRFAFHMQHNYVLTRVNSFLL